MAFDLDKLHALWRADIEPSDADLPTLADLRQHRVMFPVEAVQRHKRVLCLFCSLFCGRSDVIYIHDAKPQTVTLVDLHASGIAAMRRIYPPHWRYVCADYREFLAADESGGYDLVVADQPKALAHAAAIDMLPLVARLCAPRWRLVVNYWDTAAATLGAEPTDRAALSEALGQRTGLRTRFHEMLARGPDIHWAVIDVGPPESTLAP